MAKLRQGETQPLPQVSCKKEQDHMQMPQGISQPGLCKDPIGGGCYSFRILLQQETYKTHHVFKLPMFCTSGRQEEE